LADSASLLQVKATERVQDQSEASALTQNAAVTQRCSDSADDPCAFTPWTAWSGCSKACGTGIETRTRQTINPEKCTKECIKEAQTCNVDPCTTPHPPTPTKMCEIYGDPHVIAFDGHKDQGATALLAKDGVGVLWAVKSDQVKIQLDCSQKSLGSGTGTGWGRPNGLAVAGHGYRLVFLQEGKKTLLDGKEILQDTSTYKSEDGLVEVKHVEKLGPDEEEWKKAGYDQANIHGKIDGAETWIWRLGKPGKKTNIYFALEDSIIAIIRMPKVDGMDGVCGNFDGDRENDFEFPEGDGKKGKHVAGKPTKISNRMTIVVGANDPENMFATAGAGLLQEENRVVSRRTMTDCDPELKKKAEETCAEIAEKGTLRADCVFDICMTGELKGEKDELEVEVLDTIARKEQED